MTAQEVQSLIVTYLRGVTKDEFWIEALEPGRVRVRFPFYEDMLRPGGRISGPAMFTATDVAMYCCVLAHVGPQLMTVTADMSLRFLRAAKAADMIVEVRLLKLSPRLAILEASLFSDGEPEPACHATGSFAIPKPEARAAG